MCDNKQRCVDEIERLSNSVQRLRDENKRLTAELEQAKAALAGNLRFKCHSCRKEALRNEIYCEDCLPDAIPDCPNPADVVLEPYKAAPVAVPDEAVWNQVEGRDGFKFTEGWNACREAMLNAAPPAPAVDEQERKFKAFHKMLCDRFGYTHDEQYWQRDLVSLMEHIAAPKTPAVDLVVIGALETIKRIAAHPPIDRAILAASESALKRLRAQQQGG